jgi:D-alanyl-D-alanine carboxypeptidase
MNRSRTTPRVEIAAMTPSTGCGASRPRQLVRGAAVAAAASLLWVSGAWASGADAASARTTTSTPSAVPATNHGPSTRSQLRHILKSHYAARDFVGARIATLERDGTITEAAAGTASVGRPSRPIDPDLPWNIGSVTKTFVAVVVLQLAEEGAIDLDAPIDSFMPDLPDADRITPRQLLQHTSGLAEYINQPAVVNDQERTWTPSELIAVAEAAGRVGEPGGRFHYANTNYIILGEIIEQVTGNSWADEVRTRIVASLGLTGTREMTDERPVGYKYVGDALVESTSSCDPSVGGAAGALLSTNRDLLAFGKALTDGTLLSSDSTAAMRTFVPGEDYSQFGIVHGSGLGLEQYATDAITVDGHMGVGEAQSAFLGFDVERGTVVAVQTNVAVGGPQAFMAIEALTAIGDAG